MPAPDVAPLAAPAALGRSRAGPGRALTAPTAGFDFSGFAGFFGSGSAFAEGRIFSEGFSMTGFAFATGAGSAGAATGAGAGAAWGRPREAGLTTRTGRDIGTKTGALRGLPMKRRSARNPACARIETAAVREREARPVRARRARMSETVSGPGSAAARVVMERPRPGARSPFRGSRHRAG